MKKAGEVFSPFAVAWWRVFWGAVVLGGLCWRQGVLKWPQRRHWLPLIVVTILGCAAPYVVQPIVVNQQGSAFMAMNVSGVPLLTIVMSIPILGTYPSRRQFFGVCVALGCMGLMVRDGLDRAISLQTFALAFTVPLGYAITNISIRRWLHDVPSLWLTFVALAVSTVVLAPVAFFPTKISPLETTWWIALTELMLLGVFGTGLATFWFNRLVQNQGPLFAGMTTNLVPVGAVLWGSMDREQISMRQIIALAGIIVAVACVQYRPQTPGSRAE